MTVRGPIDEVVVVIPARNEEELLPRCLDALSAAIAEVQAVRIPRPPVVSVVIVLDRCTDQTARIAAGWPDFARLHIDTGIVGTARREGVRHLLPSPARYTGSTWIATTDADSAVPPNWLTAQLAFARNDVDLVILNDAPPHLARAIVTTGRRVFCANSEADHAFVRTIMLRAADLEPFLRRARRVKLRALKR